LMKRSAAKKGQLKKQERTDVKPAAAREAAVAKFFKGWRLALWAGILLGAFAAQAIMSMVQKTPTSDETSHLPAGYSYLKTGDYRLNPEHPPLAKMIAAFPLLFLKIDGRFDSWSWLAGDTWNYGWELLYAGNNDAYRIFFWGRLSMVVLSLCLGVLVFFWARKLYGNYAGLFALFLFAFCPNLIAHGSLTNTDLAVTFFLLLALFCFDRALRGLTPLNAALAGLTLGLALLAKFSAPLALPIMAVVAVVRVFDREPLEVHVKRAAVANVWRAKAVALLALFAVMLVLAYGVVWAGYRFRFSAFADGTQRQLFFPNYFNADASAAYRFLHDNRLLPQAYIEGFQYVGSTMGRRSFLDGERNWSPADPEHTAYWPHYFIMTTLYKTPVPMLLFFAAAVCAAYWWSRRTWRRETPLIAGMLIYFGVASLTSMNIGHRHILPVIPMAFIFVGKIAGHLRGRRLPESVALKAIFGVLLAWYVFGAVSIFPNDLAYFNEIAGGPANGAQHLTDSNLDWGQDLILLKRYMDEHDIKEMHLIYFGSADPRYYGLKYKFLELPIWSRKATMRIPLSDFSSYKGVRRGEYIAISATLLQESFAEMRGIAKLFRERTPVAKVGYSIYVYKSPLDWSPLPAEEIEKRRDNAQH